MSNFTGGQSGAGTNYQQQNSSFNTGPWQPQQPFVNSLFSQAGALLNNGQGYLQPFPGSNNVPINDIYNSGVQGVVKQTNQGAPALGAASNFIQDQLAGKYLSPNSNPYLAGMEQAAADPVIRQYQTAIAPQTASNAEMGNRYGSGWLQTQQSNDQYNLGQALQNLSSNFYGNAYNQGVQNMFTAGQMAPSITEAGFIPSLMEMQAGGSLYGMQQGQLNNQIQQYMQNQMLPWQTLGMYQGLVGGNYGSSGTGSSYGQTQQPYYSNPLGSILGGGLAGLGVAGQLGWQPFGAAAGAGAGANSLGGLLGLAAV